MKELDNVPQYSTIGLSMKNIREIRQLRRSILDDISFGAKQRYCTNYDFTANFVAERNQYRDVQWLYSKPNVSCNGKILPRGEQLGNKISNKTNVQIEHHRMERYHSKIWGEGIAEKTRLRE